MILHLLIIDDEEDVLEALLPGFVGDLARRLSKDPQVARASSQAGNPIPHGERINIRVSAHGYQSPKVAQYAHHWPIHLHLHLCCEKGGSFPNALKLLKEQLVAVVVSDLRFADDAVGSRAGKFFIEDVSRRNPETFGVLYSAFQRPDNFPADRFVRKGSSGNQAGEELLEKMVQGITASLNQPAIARLGRELARRGIAYQSDDFGAVLRRLYDYAALYFGPESAREPGRRRPRPTLLLDGESGTGKTELAGLLHALSERRDSPFLAATCNQLTDETFLRSILFGHLKGSFTGANTDRPGLVQSAGKGTLLLDDLHKLSEGCSVILHSFLDDGEYSHLGQDEVRMQAHAAVVCTVEGPAWEEVKREQRLPESFLYRVEQFVLRVPPLRQRPEDIAVQARAYCQEQSERIGREMELSPEGVAWLVDYGFPNGNSRKLRDFLTGLVTTYARITEYLDVEELEEYAHDTGMSGYRSGHKPGSPTSTAPPASEPSSPSSSPKEPPQESPAAPAASVSPAAGASPLRGTFWNDSENRSERDGWKGRIAELAVQAVVDELKIERRDAISHCERLFEEQFPSLWSEWNKLTRLGDEGELDIKLFDELFRYFAIFQFGSPARAAKELRMKDNALREFVYSREQKRLSNS